MSFPPSFPSHWLSIQFNHGSVCLHGLICLHGHSFPVHGPLARWQQEPRTPHPHFFFLPSLERSLSSALGIRWHHGYSVQITEEKQEPRAWKQLSQASHSKSVAEPGLRHCLTLDLGAGHGSTVWISWGEGGRNSRSHRWVVYSLSHMLLLKCLGQVSVGFSFYNNYIILWEKQCHHTITPSICFWHLHFDVHVSDPLWSGLSMTFWFHLYRNEMIVQRW